MSELRVNNVSEVGGDAVISSGVLDSGSLPAGSVLQVVQSRYNTETTIASTSFADTGLSASITPTSTTSKILVFVSQSANFGRDANTLSVYWQLVREATNILTYAGQAENLNVGGGAHFLSTLSNFQMLDEPNTVSSITYKVQGRQNTGADNGFLVCQHNSTWSIMTLMEVA